MANIIVDLPAVVSHGQAVTFKSPASCAGVSGLVVRYPQEGAQVSKTFQFADAHGNNVGGKNLFAENVLVKVILDTELNRAYIQNADTNKYIEETFLKRSGGDMGGHRITGLPIPQSGSEPATKEFVENFTVEGSTYVATDDNKDGNIVLRPYVADADELEFRDHIKNKNNPHGVTIAQIGAAPAGYGLGGYATKYVDDLNAAKESGWYGYGGSAKNNPAPGHGGTLFVSASYECIEQIAYPIGYGAEGVKVKRVTYPALSYTGFAEWEWVNPPMAVGVEYRTTERYGGAPVYQKVVYLGALPNSTVKTYTNLLEQWSQIIEVKVNAYHGFTSTESSGSTIPMDSNVYFNYTHKGITVNVTSDYSNYVGFAVLKYNK